MPIEILMPALSPTMEEGTLSKWLVKAGDSVSSGDLLAEIETDKATMEIEAVDEGVMAKILVQAGTEGVKVNAPIALLLEEDEDASALKDYQPNAPKIASGPSTPPSAPPQMAPPSPPTPSQPDTAQPSNNRQSQSQSDGARLKVSPLARRMAKDLGLDLTALQGSGPNGRIIKADIERAQSSGISPMQSSMQGHMAPASMPAEDMAASTELGPVRSGGAQYLTQFGIEAGSYSLEPLDGMRRVIASRLSASNANVPDFPLNIDCEIDALLAMRKELNAQAPEGVKISVNDMLIRACALALREVPAANASFTPDGIAYHKHADISVAVAIDGGLITPIIHMAETKGLSVISTQMKDLAARAHERKLQPQEYQGGTFSISNLGMMGVRNFGSIINEPQGMILSVGAGEPRAVVREGELAVATVMSVTLTCDHRVVDGALGARWLATFKAYVQSPITMML